MIVHSHINRHRQGRGLPLRRSRVGKRSAFTLIELLLALSLVVIAAALVGSIIQMYTRNYMERGEDLRRKQLANKLLHMIADDIRSVVLEQEYDGSVLETQLGASGGGGGSGAATGGGGGGQSGGATASGGASGAEAGATSGGAADSGLASSSSTSSSAAATSEDGSMQISTAYPPGIYGSQNTLMVEVSRLPRAEEYAVQPVNLMDGTLTDVPGDIKTVQYFVQAATSMGVSDSMSVFGSDNATSAVAGSFTSGLVRRALDRGVTAFAEENGDTDRLQRTGDLVAPEVIGLDFGFYDGSLGQWVTEWDSSQQSLPLLIRVSLAMQNEKGRENTPIEAGTLLSSLSIADRQAYGLEVYELIVSIPGANLVAAEAQEAGMDSMGL